jgi:hypothetical protein
VSHVTVRCPRCNEDADLAGRLLRRRVHCPYCGHRFFAARPRAWHGKEGQTLAIALAAAFGFVMLYLLLNHLLPRP